ncbi:TonB-dependent receptor plug domain-containing protein [Aurantiacibacter poecillastricola]|uniref:TonB-dependent receptor plug domain-containing protein n=1 Tax=Aurantiacibacter poecillastricola TaxID=3064385 RepID=UPI00273F28AE|nr:TonB-dependent receptor [Aurantiacibacter sp. 219JJ12-13]MDP5261648.1 TonB-dependent receptor [Aurantiacibacter sp. 219JJ12-13]
MVLKYLFSGVSLAVIAVPAIAQEEPLMIDMGSARIPEETITVTATGTRIELEDTGQAITVIGEDEIEAVQGADLTRLLERAPGVVTTRNGGAGSFTGVRVRGAEAEQVLVVVDGVRMADPAAPAGGFDFGTLLALDLQKLEILRGSNSTIWGSDAIGGVVVASTRAASGLKASAEYGARDTASARVSGGVSDSDTGFLGASVTWFKTDGISAADAGTEADGFEQWALNGHARYYFNDRFEVFARTRYASGELQIDGFPAPAFTLADTDEVQETRQWTGSTGAVLDTGALFLSGAYSFADTVRDNFDADGTLAFASDGRSDRVDLRGEWRPIGPLLVHFGAESEWTQYETDTSVGEDTRISGAYGQAGIEWNAISGHIGARVDDHADFGTAVSFGADASYAIADGLRLRASVGEGFKAPSLFQLYSDYGNLALEPEQSTSFDLGLAYGDRTLSSRPVHGAVTLFQRNTDNQIAFVSCFGESDGICTDRPFGTYDNVARTRARGVEAEAWGRIADTVTLGVLYAFTDSENRDTGLDLARRPRHAATVTGEWQAVDAVTLGADLRIVSDSYDDAANLVRLDGYEILTLRASWSVSEQVELFGRVENLWDEQYQTAAGYGTAGTGAHIGARVALP